MPQRTALEVKNELINTYKKKPKTDKRGPYLLTSQAFKTIGNRNHHRHAFGQEVKKLLEEDGYTLIDLHNNFELIGIFKVSYLERKLDIFDEYDLDIA